MTFNLTDALFRNNYTREQRTAILAPSRHLTFRELRAYVNRATHWLLRHDLKPEERVLLIMEDSPELVASFLAVVQAGGVAVPLNPWLPVDDYHFYFQDSRARLLITDRESEQLPALTEIQILKSSSIWDLSPEDDFFREILTLADDAAFWLYSSGSTGRPKAVVHAQTDLIASCDSYGHEILGILPHDVLFSTAKIFFAYGLGNSLAFPIYFGASVVLDPQRTTPERITEIFRRYRPTIFFSVPSFYSRLLTAPTDLELKSLRLCISAGEHLPVEVFQRWKETTGLEIIDGLGTTEMTHIFISNRQGACKAGSSGRKVPGYDTRITNDLGSRLPPYEIGNLMVSGDSAALYYWHNREKTREIFQGRWVLTGDKYYVDDEGYYYFSGRADDLFKVGGAWVVPRDVENALLTHKAVREAAVVGIRGENGLVKAHAYVVLKDGHSSEGMDLRLSQHLKSSQLQGYMIPRAFHFVGELPRTFTGKVQRFKLREQI
ncbi:MAG TPA: benzoate-CoA ligase family protein [Acidobacteriota bacterium]|nr:benzoate-CoA ligase family protein [Acidobacteriota bacterium]